MGQHIERVHYTAIHTALERYFDKEIPGSLTRIEYPSEDRKGDSRAKLYFAVMDEE